MHRRSINVLNGLSVIVVCMLAACSDDPAETGDGGTDGGAVDAKSKDGTSVSDLGTSGSTDGGGTVDTGARDGTMGRSDGSNDAWADDAQDPTLDDAGAADASSPIDAAAPDANGADSTVSDLGGGTDVGGSDTTVDVRPADVGGDVSVTEDLGLPRDAVADVLADADGGLLADAGGDAVVDAGSDPSVDAVVDAGSDPPVDVVDVGSDPPVDVLADADGGLPTDTGSDVGSDAGPSDQILTYDFEESSGTVVLDTSTHQHNGVLTSASRSTDGRNGRAVNLDQAGSTVSVPSGVFGDAHQLTISTWVKLSANPSGNKLFSFGTGAGDSYLSFTSYSGAGMTLAFKPSGGAEQVLNTPSVTRIPLNVWKHVTITSSEAGTSIYIDGKVIARSATLVIDPATLGATNNNVIGADGFTGTIDEFRVYRRVVADDEIRSLAWPKSDYSILHFDEGSGTTAADSSDRHKDGTLVSEGLAGTSNTTWVPGLFGQALKLDNPTSPPGTAYVSLADGVVSDCSDLTVAGWISMEAAQNNSRYFDFGTDSTHFVSGQIRTSSSMVRFVFNSGTGDQWAGRGTSFTTSTPTWYHLAWVRDGLTIRVYLNGGQLTINDATLDAGAPSSLAPDTPPISVLGVTTKNYLGKSHLDTDRGIDATIDEVLISCRAYTGDEIKHLAYRP